MPMSEEEFTRALERAARALAGGDLRAWREAVGAIGAHASEEQWARAVRRVWGAARGVGAPPSGRQSRGERRTAGRAWARVGPLGTRPAPPATARLDNPPDATTYCAGVATSVGTVRPRHPRCRSRSADGTDHRRESRSAPQPQDPAAVSAIRDPAGRDG